MCVGSSTAPLAAGAGGAVAGGVGTRGRRPHRGHRRHRHRRCTCALRLDGRHRDWCGIRPRLDLGRGWVDDRWLGRPIRSGDLGGLRIWCVGPSALRLGGPHVARLVLAASRDGLRPLDALRVGGLLGWLRVAAARARLGFSGVRDRLVAARSLRGSSGVRLRARRGSVVPCDRFAKQVRGNASRHQPIFVYIQAW